GAEDVVEASLPAVVTAQKGLNEPRYASLKGIMAAKKIAIDTKSVADLGLDEGEILNQRVKVVALALPPEKSGGRKIDGADAAAEEAGKFGAKTLYAVADGQLDVYTTEPYAAALKQVIDQAQPSVVLFGGTSNGRDLAPRIAARVNAGVASDADRLEWMDGKLRARRPVYSGKAFATVDVVSNPAMATTRP